MRKSINSPEHTRLIRWLKNQRLHQELTMRQLAERLGVSHSFIGKIEQGERRLDVAEYLQYCEALAVNPSDGIKAMLSINKI